MKNNIKPTGASVGKAFSPNYLNAFVLAYKSYKIAQRRDSLGLKKAH